MANKYKKIAKEIKGIYTVETLCKKLKIKRQRAIYLIHKLRKIGLVKTTYLSDKKRIYSISEKSDPGGISYTQALNEEVPSTAMKIAEKDNYYIYGKKPLPEELLIYCIKKNKIRYIIASLILFRKIKDWSLLYRLAKKENLVVKIVALYEVARKTVRKVRKMPKRFYTLAKKTGKFSYIIKPYSSDDFKDIEKKYKIFIPLNIDDLKEYKNAR